MKKKHNSQERLRELYFYLDNYMDYCFTDINMSEEVCKKMDSLYEKYYKKYGNSDPEVLKEYYGLFKVNGKIAIDPKRYKKIIGLDNDIYESMKKRSTTYFYPEKNSRNEYYVNSFVDEIDSIINYYKNTYKPIIDKSIENIKEILPGVPGDDAKLQMGYSSVAAANARAIFKSAIHNEFARRQRFELTNSLYAQFFHLMVSRIEAITVKMAKKNNPKLKRWNRNILYDGLNKKGTARDLDHFKYHDEMYCIWNFIKHNTESTFDPLLSYPEVLETEKYISGDLAVRYVKIDEELILNLLNGTKQFFIEYCEFVFDEKYSEANWNYKDFFVEKAKKIINKKRDENENPGGFDAFDDID